MSNDFVVLLVVMMTGHRPWHTPSFSDARFASYMARPNTHFAYTRGLTLEVQHLLCRALHPNPSKRATVYEFRSLLLLLDSFFAPAPEVEERAHDLLFRFPPISENEHSLTKQRYEIFYQHCATLSMEQALEDATEIQRRGMREKQALALGLVPVEWTDEIDRVQDDITAWNIASRSQQYLVDALELSIAPTYERAPRSPLANYMGTDPRSIAIIAPTPTLPSTFDRTVGSGRPLLKVPGAPRLPSLSTLPTTDNDIDLKPTLSSTNFASPLAQTNTLAATLFVSPQMGGATALPSIEEPIEHSTKRIGKKGSQHHLSPASALALGALGLLMHSRYDSSNNSPAPSSPSDELSRPSLRNTASTPPRMARPGLSEAILKAAHIPRSSFQPDTNAPKHKRGFLGLPNLLRRLSGQSDAQSVASY